MYLLDSFLLIAIRASLNLATEDSAALIIQL
jgi:hypothetical protein